MQKSGGKRQCQSFNLTFRYIDDVLTINNSRFGDYLDIIYPSELEIKDTTDSEKYVNFLDLHIEIDKNNKLLTSLYDKRDDFNFKIVNFPFMCSNIPESPTYGVFISQLIRYARFSSIYSNFLDRCTQLVRKLTNQGFLLPILKKSLKKFYGRHNDLIKKLINHLISCIYRDIVSQTM